MSRRTGTIPLFFLVLVIGFFALWQQAFHILSIFHNQTNCYASLREVSHIVTSFS